MELATGALSQLGQAEALQHCQDFVAALKEHERSDGAQSGYPKAGYFVMTVPIWIKTEESDTVRVWYFVSTTPKGMIKE
ncbi:unnamed protein product [Effrenium voratum]|uniref:Uncharacterized protein n=1 Tax=Effrenium voratum TaxID=2562239 RepID=A0AA36HTY6_9DINO|nr:unnamed protein product [Effrenium voratum]